jgi:hypothetical protein
MRKRTLLWSSVGLLAGGSLGGCTDGALEEEAQSTIVGHSRLATTTAVQLGGRLPGISAADFAAARANFAATEALPDGLGPIFNERGCGNCHNVGAIGGAGEPIERRFGRFVGGIFDPFDGTLSEIDVGGKPFVTPPNPPTGVPGNFTFHPFSDFLVHDMGTLGDMIGADPGETLAQTRRMRTAPLWGIKVRNKLLHDGRTTDIATAIHAHDGQGAPARKAFVALSSADQHAVVQFVRSIGYDTE